MEKMADKIKDLTCEKMSNMKKRKQKKGMQIKAV